MSRIRLIALFILTTIFTNAQEIPVQFALTDTAGIELPNRNIAVRTSFTSDTLAIAPEYQETQSTITNQFGIASYWIGSGITTLSSTYDNISKDWINPGSLYYIVVEVDSTGSGYQDLATIQYRFPLASIKSFKSDSSVFSITSDSASYSDSSGFTDFSDTSFFSILAENAKSSFVADTSLRSLYADTAGYANTIDPGAFSDSSSTNEIQSLEQVLSVDSNANNESIYNLKSLTIGDTLISQSAALAINRNDAGLLLPRLTKIQRDVIANPQQGLLVYCTDCENDGRVSVYDGNTWELLSQTNSSGSYAVISAGSIDNITVSGATFNGAINDSGGTSVFAKGFCLSSQPYPSLADVIIAPDLLDSSGVFRGRADYLDRNSKYYVRAYATNAAGSVYGPQQEFMTEGLLAVGDTFGGGIVGYILQPGDNGYDPGEQHGIIVAQQDFGTLLDWGSCSGSVSSNGSGGTYFNGRTSILIYDAYYNDSVWNTICPDSLTQYANYYPSLMHTIKSLTWEGYNDWTVGTVKDYEALLDKIEIINTRLSQSITGYHWTSSSYGAYNRYRFIISNVVINSITGKTEWRFNDTYYNSTADLPVRPVRYF